jgi:hypothetical protein
LRLGMVWRSWRMPLRPSELRHRATGWPLALGAFALCNENVMSGEAGRATDNA